MRCFWRSPYKIAGSVAICVQAGKPVVDLSADYRLKNVGTYEKWYQTSHVHSHLVKEAVYGLPELHRKAIVKSKLVASPGCYPTAAILQLAPLFARGLVQPEMIVIDAKSGVSGAGRSPALAYHFPEAHESWSPIKSVNIAIHLKSNKNCPGFWRVARP